MKLSVIGTGYVGLVAGTCFAESGHDVLCIDIDERKVKMLKNGECPIYEPGLTDYLVKNIKEDRLKFSTDVKKGVQESEVIFLALPTPQSEDGSADLQHVLAVAKQIGKTMNGYKVIVNKSTVPVGTADKVREVVAAETKYEFDVVSNPEFLKEGAAVNDFMKPDRVVIGSSSQRAIAIMSDLYAPFIRTNNPLIIMDERSSELTKYAANSFLATKISFMNEIAGLCERVGADVDMVRRGMGTDIRIGAQFLFAGIGYGGSCFPKDVAALMKTASDYNRPLKVLDAVEEVNRKQKRLIVEKVKKHFKNQLEGRTMAVWGLSFKPNTDDTREAPAITVIELLVKEGVKIRAYDPEGMSEMKKRIGNIVKYVDSNYDAVHGAEALLLLTEWNEFRRPDFDRIKASMKTPIIFDGRNIYDPKVMREKGFVYYGIGRGSSIKS
jgi:UDPglucose 6-dehydrogenase